MENKNTDLKNQTNPTTPAKPKSVKTVTPKKELAQPQNTEHQTIIQPQNPQKVFFNGKGQACTYDENGKVIPYGLSNQPIVVPPPKKKIGYFVVSFVSLLLAIGAAVFAVMYTFNFIESTDTGAGILALVLLLMTGIGLLIFVPGLAFSITSICCSIASTKSSSKVIKVLSIFVTIFAVITLGLILISPLFVLFVIGS